jgi:hypothetical protein
VLINEKENKEFSNFIQLTMQIKNRKNKLDEKANKIEKTNNLMKKIEKTKNMKKKNLLKSKSNNFFI